MSATASKELPRWLQMCKNEILGSHEWNTVKEDLLARLKLEVEKRGIDHLSSLPEDEKIVLLLQVQPAVMQARSYKSLLGVTSKMVGSHLLDDVNRGEGQAPSEPTPNVAPKASQIVDRAAAGAAYLLEKWPQTKAACGNLVNSEHMPHQLRRELWRAWLSRPLVASHYSANPPSHSLSMQHQLVSQTSAAVLRGIEPDTSTGDEDVAHLRVGPTPGVATALAEQRHRYSAATQEEQLGLIRRLVSVRAACSHPVASDDHVFSLIATACVRSTTSDAKSSGFPRCSIRGKTSRACAARRCS
eukprot:COSAG02_NODE_1634_length_11565_cov_4.754666_10_plen_301_part_00